MSGFVWVVGNVKSCVDVCRGGGYGGVDVYCIGRKEEVRGGCCGGVDYIGNRIVDFFVF